MQKTIDALKANLESTKSEFLELRTENAILLRQRSMATETETEKQQGSDVAPVLGSIAELKGYQRANSGPRPAAVSPHFQIDIEECINSAPSGSIGAQDGGQTTSVPNDEMPTLDKPARESGSEPATKISEGTASDTDTSTSPPKFDVQPLSAAPPDFSSSTERKKMPERPAFMRKIEPAMVRYAHDDPYKERPIR